MRRLNVCEGITLLTTDVKDILFEGLWEIPKGVTLNSYIVKGDEVALIDGFCGWDGYPESLFKLLDEENINIKQIKHIIVNHLEPDHSGWIEKLREIHSDFEIYCTTAGAGILESYFGKDMKINKVKDGDSIDLGQGRKLSFFTTPNVHWPDTMVTYDELTGTLFSCDAFGSFGTMDKSVFDDDYTDEELKEYEVETIRYYSNIVAAFSSFVLKAIEKCGGLNIKMIAPGHGLIWRKRVAKIINDYVEYANYQKGPARKEVTLLWGSMYGMTEEAAKACEEVLKESNITYHMHRVPQTNWGQIITSVWTSSAVILGMPTYENKMFPPMAAAIEELGKKKANGRKAFRFGSYSWAGGAQKELNEISERVNLGWDFMEPVEFKGKIKADDLELVKERTRELIKSIQ